MDQPSPMTTLESDLAPVYGPLTVYAAGMSRTALAEVRAFFQGKLDEIERVTATCADCAHKSGRVCRKFNATMPDGYTGDDCPEWQYDGVPF